MKTTFYMLFVAVMLNISSAGAQSKDELAVTAALETLKKGMLDGDGKLLESITSEKLTYGHSGGKMEDKAAFVKSLASGASDFITMDISEQTISVSGDVAIVRHKLGGKTMDGGNPGTISLGVMQVWQKQNGSWKLIGRQAFKLPVP